MVTRENRGGVVWEVVFEIDLQGLARLCVWLFRMELYPPCFGPQNAAFLGKAAFFSLLNLVTR